MTDINPQYRKLAKTLKGTRKTLTEACREHNLDIDDVDDYYLQQAIDQCSHCNIWSTALVDDLDGNPICGICESIIGR